jgi:hypothetical protein
MKKDRKTLKEMNKSDLNRNELVSQLENKGFVLIYKFMDFFPCKKHLLQNVQKLQYCYLDLPYFRKTYGPFFFR